jgi:hypothetical protein
MPIAQLVDQRHEMSHRSAKPIQSPDEQNITLAKLREASVESGALVLCARGLVGEDRFLGDAVLQKSVDLECEILVLRADAGIPDKASAIGDGDRGITLLSVLMCV